MLFLGILESVEAGDWSEWKQDCLASLLKMLCFLGIKSEDADCLNDQLYEVDEVPRKKTKRRKLSVSIDDKTVIPRMNEVKHFDVLLQSHRVYPNPICNIYN